jgi:hypothetical protein
MTIPTVVLGQGSMFILVTFRLWLLLSLRTATVVAAVASLHFELQDTMEQSTLYDTITKSNSHGCFCVVVVGVRSVQKKKKKKMR